MNQQMSYFVQDLKLPIMLQQDHHLNLYTNDKQEMYIHQTKYIG